MSRALVLLTIASACSSPARHRIEPVGPRPPEVDPDGPHHDAVTKQLQPFIDAEIASGIVVGLYDAGKVEIYGFGNGPGGKPPTGRTLYEIGSVTQVYTSLLFADAIQRTEVELDTPLAELLPPGVTAPTKDKVAIRLRHLALHSSGLPRLPPTIARGGETGEAYAKYGEDALYADLIHTPLEVAPGEKVVYSNFGAGALGFVLGKKLGGGYAKALTTRVLVPLGLTDTYVALPTTETARRATGTTDDLAAAPAWTYDALAGAGAIVSTAREQLKLIDAELDAASGGSEPLRHAMKLTQEPQLDKPEENEGLGWQIDKVGRYWHNGSTGGFHAFVGFDPKSRRGVVILASTATSLLDHLSDALYGVLDGTQKPPAKFPTAAQLTPFAGTYDLAGEKINLVAAGNRLYVDGKGEPRHRLVPISDHEFWIEALQAVAILERDPAADKVLRVVFLVGDHQLVANRVE